MTRRRQLFMAMLLMVGAVTISAQQKSAKRGIGWDEKTRAIAADDIRKLAPGISWVYTWAVAPKQTDVEGLGPDGDVDYVPMCWNGNFNETALRQYLTAHPGVKYLLGFNEPNFSAQANMTPQQAADDWPKLEQIADDFGLKLVAPALNYTGEKVGGKTWQPLDWYDEFFRLRPNARVDCMALHCYMNWASAVSWFASEYLYTATGDNLYSKATKEKYPNLVSYLDRYKEAHGHFPRMFLTEFCSWSDNEYPNRAGLTEDFQIDQMTQKVQYLEQSDLVEGYAWFMANPKGGRSEHPHESMLETSAAGSELSPLGKVLVYMSSFDKTFWHQTGNRIAATDYIDSWNDNDHSPSLRPSTDPDSDLPIEIAKIPQNGWTDYQIELPADGEYRLTLRLQPSATTAKVMLSLDGKEVTTETLSGTRGEWQTSDVTLQLSAGQHRLRLTNTGQTFRLNWLRLDTTSGIATVTGGTPVAVSRYSLQGMRLATPRSGLVIERTTNSDGTTRVTKRVASLPQME